MQVTLEVFISGQRDGAPWPPKGTAMDLPDDEAKVMIAAGMASVLEVPLESAVAPAPQTPAPPVPETTVPPTPETPAPAAPDAAPAPDAPPAPDAAPGKTKGA